MNNSDIVRNFKIYLVLGVAASKFETFVWIFNYVLKSVTSSRFDLKASKTWTDGHSQCYLSCDGVNLWIGSNLKLAPVPCAISELPIKPESCGVLLDCTAF